MSVPEPIAGPPLPLAWTASFGPLKYHFDDSEHLSSDELRAMVEAFGFTVLEWSYHWTDYVTSFQADNSLQPERYRALRFVACNLGVAPDHGCGPRACWTC